LLKITRRVGEGMTIGDDTRLVVLKVRGKQVYLGIEAPSEIVVMRDEIFQRLTKENKLASRFELRDLQEWKSLNGHLACLAPPAEPPWQGRPMTIDSSKFGTLQFVEDQVITFKRGLLGFCDYHRYILLSRPETSPLSGLQCVDQPELAFLVATPANPIKGLNLGRLNTTLQELKALSPDDLQVFVTFTIPPGRPTEATANFSSPILINPRTRLGKQVLLENQTTFPSNKSWRSKRRPGTATSAVGGAW
jgi:flagellar assembly factor FliW